MKETQKTIVNALAITVVATLFFFALTFILFSFFKAETSLKDAWETLGSFFGGITTLVAAYVATKLFNDWRDMHRATYISSVGDSVGNMVSSIFQKIIELDLIISNSENIRNNRHITLVSEKDRTEIYENIPHIENLCQDILYKVTNLELGIVQLQIIDKNQCCDIEQYYLDFKRTVELEVGKILKKPHPLMRYQKISSSRSLISLAQPKYKSLQKIIYQKIYDLNNPK